MIKKIDTFLLSCCTRFSHALQRTTGLTCYFVAKIGIGLVALNMIVEILDYYLKFLVAHTQLFGVIMNAIILVIMVARTAELAKAEENIGNKTKPRQLLRYIFPWWWRIFWLTFFIWDSLATVFIQRRSHHHFLDFVDTLFFSMGLVIFYYFVAVDPLPPGTSKVKKFINSLFHVHVPVRDNA